MHFYFAGIEESEIRTFVNSLKAAHCKEAETKLCEETLLVLKANVMQKAKDINDPAWRDYLMKTIYLYMLGYDIDFMSYHVIKLVDHKNLKIKILAYLTCTLILQKDSELLLLITASILKDLRSKLSIKITFALNTLAKFTNKDLIEYFLNDILLLCKAKLGSVRRKSMIVLQTIFHCNPLNLIKNTEIHQQILDGLNDKDPCLIGISLNLLEDMMIYDKQAFKAYLNDIIKLYKSLITLVFPSEYRHGALNLPWCQIKILSVIRRFCEYNPEDSQLVYKVLGDALEKLKRINTRIGYSVLCECIKTVCMIVPNYELINLASEQLDLVFQAAFPQNDIDLCYMALKTLSYLARIGMKYTTKYQVLVVEALESNELILQNEAVEILANISNHANTIYITNQLIECFKNISEENLFKKKIMDKILLIVDKHSPDFKFYSQTIFKILFLGEKYITEEIFKKIIVVFKENIEQKANLESLTNDKTYDDLLKAFQEFIKKENLPELLAKLMAFSCGEIVVWKKQKKLEKSQGLDHNDNLVAEHDIIDITPSEESKDSSLSNTISTIYDILLNLISRFYTDELTKCCIINAVYKVYSAGNIDIPTKIQTMIQKYQQSKYTLIQEFSKVFIACIQMPCSSSKERDYHGNENIDYSKHLGFLDKLADDSIKNGYKIHNSHKSVKKILANSTINFFCKNSLPEEPSDQNPDVLKVSKLKWTKEGFIENGLEPRPFLRSKSKDSPSKVNFIGQETQVVKINLDTALLSMKMLENYGVISSVETQREHINGINEDMMNWQKPSYFEVLKLLKELKCYGAFCITQTISTQPIDIFTLSYKGFDSISKNDQEILLSNTDKFDQAIVFIVQAYQEFYIHVKGSTNQTVSLAFSTIFHSLIKEMGIEISSS